MEPVVHYDTAGAARDVSLNERLNIAAIGSSKAAEIYGLEILRENLEDVSSNTTRFMFLKKGPYLETAPGKGKCSLLMTLDHVPGALFAALQLLAGYDLNLTQIVSRPIQEKPFEYLFFIDILFSEKVDLNEVLEKLKERTQTLKLIGIYAPAQ